MKRRLAFLWTWWYSDEGATTAEYALILALVAVVLIGVLTELGGVLQQRIRDIIQSIQGAGGL